MPATNSRFFQPRRQWRRLLSVALVIALVAPVLGSPAMRGQSEAPLDVPYGPVLSLVSAAGDAPPAPLPPPRRPAAPRVGQTPGSPCGPTRR